MARPSYLLSFISIQALRLQATFAAKYPGAWLIWEPGAWQPPSRAMVNTVGVPVGAPATAPTQTDSLCFSLGRNVGLVSIGRAPENDCVVSDATVSRHHADLFERAGRWWVRAAEGRQLALNGQPLTAEAVLSRHDHLQLGNVTLTFEDEPGMAERALR
ncbi:MAG: FHA domain-containing protein [Myxococcales bacterium]|nr:FHA domain-containing protein [Myxococcales bacterium]